MIMRKRRGGRGPKQSIDAAMEDIQAINLLSASQLRELFHDSRIEREKFCGLTKSIIAIR